MRSRIQVLVKVFEYGWLNGLYRIQDWSPADWEVLLNRLAKGGWAEALELEARARTLFGTKNSEWLEGALEKARKKQGLPTMSIRVPAEMGTNARNGELACVKAILCGHPVPARGMQKAGVYTTIFLAWNLLAEIPQELGLSYMPVPKAKEKGRALGAPPVRTATATPAQVKSRLINAYHWVFLHGPKLIAFVRQHLEDLKANGLGTAKYDRGGHQLKRRIEVWDLAEEIGMQVGGWHGGKGEKVSVKDLIREMQGACFDVIACMNGRRRDEVVGSAIGLYVG